MLFARIVLVYSFLLVPSFALAKTEKTEYPAKDLTRAQVHNLSGKVKVTVSKDEYAHLVIKKIKWHKECDLNIVNGIDILEVKVEDNGSGFARDGCKADLGLQVPSRVALEIKSGSGNVDISGIEGAIDFKLGSGDVKIESNSPEVKGTAGSGDIEIVGEVSSTSLRTGSGDVKIIYNHPMDRGLIDIKTGSGNADIALPSTMKVLTDFRAGSGKIKNEFGDDESAKFKLSMRAGSGDLRVRKIK